MNAIKTTCATIAVLFAMAAPAAAAPSTITFDLNEPVVLPAGVDPGQVLVTASERRGEFVETTILLNSGKSLSYITVQSQPFARTEAYKSDAFASLGK
jgi:hypothetical protein